MLRLPIALAASALFAVPALAQSVWGVSGPPAAAVDFAGPPAGPCADPTGPVIGGFPYFVPFACPTAGPFPPPIPGGPPTPGDITVDRINDLVFICNGGIITGYTRAGVPVVSFPSPLPMLTGLGWAATSPAGVPVLWLSTAALAAAIPYPIAGCLAAPPPFIVPPFPVAMPGMCTDIDYDPVSGTLFESNSPGVVTNQLVGGGPGPFAVFAPGAPCPLPSLQGIAVDTAACGVLYVTDGALIRRVTFAGAAAALTFYAPIPCWPAAGPGPLSGLGFDATPVAYAMGCGIMPVAGTVGEALTPNPGFGVTFAGGIPGSSVFLVVGAGAACPRVPIGFGCTLATFPIAALIGPIVVPPGGAFTLPAPLPPGLGCSGATGYVQWIDATAAGAVVGVSNALHIRPAVP